MGPLHQLGHFSHQQGPVHSSLSFFYLQLNKVCIFLLFWIISSRCICTDHTEGEDLSLSSMRRTHSLMSWRSMYTAAAIADSMTHHPVGAGDHPFLRTLASTCLHSSCHCMAISLLRAKIVVLYFCSPWATGWPLDASSSDSCCTNSVFLSALQSVHAGLKNSLGPGCNMRETRAKMKFCRFSPRVIYFLHLHESFLPAHHVTMSLH